MSISNLSRLYLINCNLKAINKNLNDFNIFENIRFAEELSILEIQINRMREILDDMRGLEDGTDKD